MYNRAVHQVVSINYQTFRPPHPSDMCIGRQTPREQHYGSIDWELHRWDHKGVVYLLDEESSVAYKDCPVTDWPKPVGVLEDGQLLKAELTSLTDLFTALDDVLKEEHLRFQDLFAE